jgi:uncharacterized protein
LYENGTGLSRDVDRAAAIYSQHCTTGDSLYGCLPLGLLYLTGNGLAKDVNKAFALFRQACKSAGNSGNLRVLRV